MVTCYPSTPLKKALHVGCFLFGATLMCIGGYLSFANVERQQALIKARNDFVRERLKRRSGK
ncbi:hypothetical protein PVL29_025774 [Vitis rotundifolia]|uniref:Uncharacterized protein n=1 Tax=Vitis rotundifolia TaxID=103349 RepID=A0AA39D7Q7_VITRO|nr:hypothetical protein PVL29_025774 [Vitis rotundifolia]